MYSPECYKYLSTTINFRLRNGSEQSPRLNTWYIRWVQNWPTKTTCVLNFKKCFEDANDHLKFLFFLPVWWPEIAHKKVFDKSFWVFPSTILFRQLFFRKKFWNCHWIMLLTFKFCFENLSQLTNSQSHWNNQKLPTVWWWFQGRLKLINLLKFA